LASLSSDSLKIWSVKSNLVEAIVIPFEQVLNDDKPDDQFHIAANSEGTTFVVMRGLNNFEVFTVDFESMKYERRGKL
jgi:hypothetical protein